MSEVAAETPRLVLRNWRDADVASFAAMFRDAEVMRYLGGVPADPLAEARAAIERQRAGAVAHGHCFWAVERRADGALLGFCGLRVGGHPATPVAGALEIGWRLRRDAWGQGYAREAARAALDWGWENASHDRILAWTVPANSASRGLMIRLGMARRPELDFGHPAFAPDHPLHIHLVHVANRPGCA